MRFLKKKIALALKSRLIQSQVASRCLHGKSSSRQVSELQPQKRQRFPGNSSTSNNVKVTKNIVTNYGKAISSFAISELATPYITPLLEKDMITIKAFQQYVADRKEEIRGILSLRRLLIISSNDTAEEAIYKKTFQAVGEVFIKYFSVNWITHGRMNNKDVYLKYRFKMLRRIRNPEWFTYLKATKKLSKFSKK